MINDSRLDMKYKAENCNWDEISKIRSISNQQEHEKRLIEKQKKIIDKIPGRYRELLLKDFKTIYPEQVIIKNIIKGYIDTFEQRQTEGACVIFLGKPGTGKTMMSLIMYKELALKGKRVGYESSLAFLKVIQEKKYESSNSYQSILDFYKQIEFLIIDEASESVTKDGCPSEFEKKLIFDVINARYEMGNRSTLIISNRCKDELTFRMGNQVIDRILEKGILLGFNWNSFRS